MKSADVPGACKDVSGEAHSSVDGSASPRSCAMRQLQPPLLQPVFLVLPHLRPHHTRFCSHSLLRVVVDGANQSSPERYQTRVEGQTFLHCRGVETRRSCRKLTRRQPSTFSRRPLISIPPLPTSKTSCATSAVSATASSVQSGMGALIV